MTEKPKMKVQLIIEGDSEYNYFSVLKKEEELDIVYKTVNVGGGGYKCFLEALKTEGEYGYIAKFIILDYDRAISFPEEVECFKKIIEYCKSKNKFGRIPYFIIVNNFDFEYFACLHSPQYKNDDTTQFIIKIFNYKSLSAFKSDERVFYTLNTNQNSYTLAITKLINDRRPTIIENKPCIKGNGINIDIKNQNIQYNPDASVYKNSNMTDLFLLICRNR